MADSDPLDPGTTRHLLRRTGFGAPADQVAEFQNLTRGEAAAQLLDFTPSRFRPTGSRNDRDRAHNKWVKYMIRARYPLQEKLGLFWHDHFATGVSVVFETKFMANQNRTLRQNCKGNFRDLVKAINIDAAMMRFLDTDENNKEEPNENYARELQELFTLGVYDTAGNPNYTQTDIVQIARAFTGWRYEDNGIPYLDTNQHDYMADWPGRGLKEIYATTGQFAGGQDFAANGEGEAEINTVIDIIFNHRDTNGQNTVARRTARRLFEYFANSTPPIAAVDQVIGESNFDTTWDISALLRRMFVHDEFYETSAGPPYTAASKKSVKWPIDYVVSTLRQLNMKLKGRDQYVSGGEYGRIIDYLRDMGQEVLDPPSVFGWEWETAWISSAALLARCAFARDVTAARYGGGRSAFRPEDFVDLSETDPDAIVNQVTDALGVTDQLSPDEHNVLVAYLTDSGPISLPDYYFRNTKLNGLFALVLQSPAYQLQ